MSIPLIVTRGFGNGTLTGAIKDVVTRGYTIGEVVIPDYFIGSGIMMYSKDGNYYVLNTNETSPTVT